jgi:type IV secretory pathway protease TraF
MSLERFGLVLLGSILLALGTLRLAGITGNLTPSEPVGLYLRLPQAPTRGEMIELRPLVKHLAGVPGDTVDVTAQGSYINGHLWPNSAPILTAPYRMYPFGTYRLAPGQYWLMGSSPVSWDSRYVGPFSGDLIESAITPLWTIDR